MMKSTAMFVAVLAGTYLMLTNAPVVAEDSPATTNAPAVAEVSPAKTNAFAGDWLLSSTFSGARSNLAAKGVTFDASLTQVGQGIVNGGKNSDWEYGGRYNLTMNVDSQKMGLWPGGFAMVEIEGNYDRSANGYSGALMPVSTSQVFPLPSAGGDNFGVPNVSVMQFISTHIGFTAGKLDTTSGDMNEFAHGKGDKQFMNLAFNLNPTVFLTCPYSILGAAMIILPVAENPDASLITLSVLQSTGKPTTTGFNDISSDNLSFFAEGRVRTDFLGHTGHQLAGFGYSDKTFSSLDQSLRFIIENEGAIKPKSGSWCAYYNFDQYFYEPKKGAGQGLGVFGRFGASDGNPNPCQYFYSFGLGGKGCIPGRAKDQYGIGYYFLDVKSPNFTGPLATHVPLRDEYGVEAYYNFALTPWIQLTPDIQVVRPSQKQQLITHQSVDTATILSVRLNLIF